MNQTHSSPNQRYAGSFYGPSLATPPATPISPLASMPSLDTTPASDTSPDEQYNGSTYDSSIETATTGLTPVIGMAPLASPRQSIDQSLPPSNIRSNRFSAFKYNRSALLVTTAVISLILVIGLGTYFFGSHATKSNTTAQSSSTISSQYAVGSLPLSSLAITRQLKVGPAEQLTINGLLQANNTIILSPTAAPTTPLAGQIYYDEVTNQPYFYNGTKFVSLNPLVPVVGTSIGGLIGAIGIGQGLTLAGNQLGISNSVLNNMVTSISGTANQILTSATKGDIHLSLPQDIATTSAPTFGGLTINGTHIVNGNTQLNGQLQVSGSALFRNQTNSATAFQIQNASSNSIFSVNSTNGRVGINTSTPSASLEIHATSSTGIIDVNGSFSNSFPGGPELITNGDFSSASPAGPELVTNGSFTGNSDNWTLGSDVVYGSNNVTSTYAGNVPYLSTTFDTIAGETYTLNFNISNANAPMCPYTSNNSNSLCNNPITDGVHSLSFTATYTGTDTITFDDWNYAVGDTWTLDNVSIVKRAGPTNWALGDAVDYGYRVPTGPQLITNGTFTGNASGWTLGSDAAYNNNNVTITSTGTDAQLSTTFETVAGDTYSVSFTVSGSNTTVDGWLDNSPAPSINGNHPDGVYTSNFIATYTGTETMHFELGDWTPGNTATLDNVSVVQDSWVPGSKVTSTFVGGDTSVSTPFETVAGKNYAVTFTVSDANSPVYVSADNYGGFSHNPFANGTYTEIFTAGYTGTDTLRFSDSNGSIGDIWSIDNVSVTQKAGPNSWILGNNVTYNGSSVVSTYDGYGDPALSTTFETIAGNNYTIGFTVSNSNAPMSVSLDNNPSPFSDGPYTDGTYSKTFTANFTGTETIHFDETNWNPGDTWTLDNVSINVLDNQTPVIKVVGQDGNTWLSLAAGNLSVQASLSVSGSSLFSGSATFDSTAQPTGPELITNGTFTGGTTGWTLGSDVAYGTDNVVSTYNGTGDPSISTTFDTVAGNTYIISFTTSNTNNSVYESLTHNLAFGDQLLNGKHTLAFKATFTGADTITFNSYKFLNGDTYTLDDVSIRLTNDTSPTLKVVGYDGNNWLSLGGDLNNNTAIGDSALQSNNTGMLNAAIGAQALLSNISGNWDTAVGAQSLQNNTSGNFNAAFGALALKDNTLGSFNIATGVGALYSNTTGSNNAAIGDHAGVSITTGSSNTLLGMYAGNNLTTGSDNVAIGQNTAFASATADNQLQIGAGISGDLGLGTLAVKTVTNTTVAFQVQNAAGASILNVDSTNARVSVGSIGTPTGQLYVAGQIPTAAIGTIVTGSSPSSVAVNGHYAYVVNEASNNLTILDVSNPAVPTLVGTVATGVDPISVVVSGRYAYVVSWTSNNLQIFDVSNPALPTSVASVATGTNPVSIKVSGRYAYVVSWTSNNLQIFDVSNPALPTSVASVATGTNPHGVIVDGRYAYIVNYTDNTLQTFDVNNPAAPTSVSTVATGTRPASVAVNGRYAYIVNDYSSRNMQIFDISNPAAPTLVGSIGTAGDAASVAINGRYAYVVTNFGVLEGYDISNPASPVLVGSIASGSWMTEITINGRYAYVTNANLSALQIFDIGGTYTQSLEAGSIVTTNLSVQNDATIGGSLAVNTGLTVSGSSVFSSGLAVNDTLAVKTVTNSANAFQVQDTANNNIFNVDTVSTRISIGSMGSPNGRLYVSGGLPTSAIGTVTTDTNPKAVAVNGNYSYVVNLSSNTLQIFNISNPAAPTAVGSVATGTGPTSVAISGSYAYVTNINSTTLQVFNISNPAAPTAVGSVATGTNPVAVAISGQYAYVANEIYGSSQQFQIFDISNPATPAMVGHLDNVAYYPNSVAISGRYAYLTTLNGHLDIIDVSNPAAPVAVGDVLSFGGGWTNTNSPVIVGRYAYVADALGYLEIFDVSNPASPTSVGTVASANPSSVAVSGRYAYVASNTANTTLQIFDVSNPASPTSVGTVITGAGPHAVVTSSHYAYVVNSGANTLQIFDLGGADLSVNNDAIIGGNLSVQAVLSVGTIGTPTGQLYVAGQVPTAATGSVATESMPISVAISGTYAYVANSNSDTLQIFDISNPATPTSVSTVSTGSTPWSVAVSGHYAYVTNYNANSLQSFDTSNPANPVLVGTVGTGTQPASVVISGRYAYVASVGANLQIFDISNPATLILVSSVATGSIPVIGAVNGHYAYVTNWNANTLQIFDISNPASPTSVGTVATGTSPADVVVSGRYAYVTNSNSWNLQIFDISNPAAPTLISSVATGTSPGAISISGRYAYVSNVGSNTMQIFDISNPVAPISVGLVSTGAGPHVTVSGRYAYVVNKWVDTLQIFDIGGTYTQALESGSTLTGTLSVTNDTIIGGSLSLGTGLTVAGASLLDGSVGINGSATFKNKVDSVVALQIQNTAAVALFTADTSGMVITISGTTSSFASLTLTDAHIKSTQTTAPTIGTPASCGVTPTATVMAGSTDTAGSLVVTAGTGSPATCDTIVTFNKAYGIAPKSVLIIAETKDGGSGTAAARQVYVSGTTVNNFTFKMNSAPAASEVDAYYYWVIE